MFCLCCGYDLQGLPEPARCPECGEIHDTEEQRRRVIEWFCSWRGVFCWKAPKFALAYLDEPECRRVGWRRITLGIVLPLILLALFGILGSGITVSTQLRAWWEFRSAPGTRVRPHIDSHENHPLVLDLHFDHLFGGVPGAEHRAEIQSQRVRWARPTRHDFLYASILSTGGPMAAATAMLALAIIIGFAVRSPRPKCCRVPVVRVFAAGAPAFALFAWEHTAGTLALGIIWTDRGGPNAASYAESGFWIWFGLALVSLLFGSVVIIRMMGCCSQHIMRIPRFVALASGLIVIWSVSIGGFFAIMSLLQIL